MAATSGPKVPPGNCIARQLKILNDDSRGKIIPTTAASRRSYNKYTSVYDVEYSNMDDVLLCQFLKEREQDAMEREKMEDARETVGDVFGVKRASKANSLDMFSNWKVPNRLMTDEECDSFTDKDMNVRQRPVTEHQMSRRGGRKPATDKLPEIRQSMSRGEGPGLKRSQSMLSDRRIATADPTQNPRDCLGSPRRSVSKRLPTPYMANSAHQELSKQDLLNALQPAAVNQAEKWMRKAPEVDKKVIQKVLRMTEKKHQSDHALKHSLQRDALISVKKWMEGATEKERDVALQFFKSLSGTKLMGSTGNEQSVRLQQVIHSLESCKPPGMIFSPNTQKQMTRSMDLHSNLKHLRLLSPTSRKNRWMETTWHHLPEHRSSDPVNNWRSVYTKPHDVIPRHFTIHPEWGV